MRLWILLTVAVLAVAATPAARADVDIDLRTGIYTDGSDGFLGGGVLWDMGQRGHWMANPNLEYVFVENGDLITLNGDVHYDLKVDAPFAIWAGGGPALLFADPDDEDAFAPTPDVLLHRSIAGALALDGGYRLAVIDSIVDAGAGASPVTPKAKGAFAPSPMFC